MDTNKKPNNFIAGLNDYIKDCLMPLYHFHCLDDMLYDPEYQNSILMYIAMHRKQEQTKSSYTSYMGTLHRDGGRCQTFTIR